jgi:hypothetical protein
MVVGVQQPFLGAAAVGRQDERSEVHCLAAAGLGEQNVVFGS